MPAGELGDERHLSERARRYANKVVYGVHWPLTPSHVDLTRVTFETSTHMSRQHGVFSADGCGNSTIRLSVETYDRADFEAMREVIRHELVHVHQHQSSSLEVGHGDSFRKWVEPLELSGRCSSHYEIKPEDYKYRFYCGDSCGFIGGRYRWSKAVRRAISGSLVCGQCERVLRVEGPNGVLEEVPASRR